MRAIRDMASSVMKCLNFTWDAPSLHKDGKMPVLDTAMWMGLAERQWDLPEDFLPAGIDPPTITGKIKPTVMYQFYRKTMANSKPMHSRSAAPEQDKIQTVTQEFNRRMKNTSRSLARSHLE